MALTEDNPTLLRLDPITVPPYASRGITQTLEPISQAFTPARTWNGKLINLSMPQMQLYRSVITCRDLDNLPLSGVWQGQILTVDCVIEQKFLTATGVQDRPEVPGSMYNEGIYTYFRPRLTMMVTFYSDAIEEYEAFINWQLEMEETG